MLDMLLNNSSNLHQGQRLSETGGKKKVDKCRTKIRGKKGRDQPITTMGKV